MAQRRISQEVWEEWYGTDVPSELNDPVTYFTWEWIDIKDETVHATLCYLLKRHGIVDSIKEAAEALEAATVKHGYIYHPVGEISPAFALPEEFKWFGPTEIEGERPATLVEFEVGN